MKKKKISRLSFSFVATALIAAISSGASFKPLQAKAAATPIMVLEDDFNNSAFKGDLDPNKWIKGSATNGIAQSSESECYLINNASSSNVETSGIATSRKITGIKSFCFDIKYTDAAKNSGKWIGVYFVEEVEQMFTGVPYDSLIRPLHDGIHRAGSVFTGGNSYNYAHFGATNPLTDWITIKISIDSSTTGKLNACVQGGEFDETKAVSFTYNRLSIDLQNAFIGICASNEGGEIRFDNFRIENDGFEIFENFSTFDPTDINGNFTYTVAASKGGDLSYCKFTVVDSGHLSFADAEVGDFIYSVIPIEDHTNGVDEVDLFNLQFKAQITQNDYKIALVFGYDPELGVLNKSTVVYEISKSFGVLKEYDAEGLQLLDEASNSHDFAQLGLEAEISLAFNRKNGLSIKENGMRVTKSGAPVTFGPINHYLGHLAIAYLEKGVATPVMVSLDQLHLGAVSYYVPITKSVTHNFSNSYWGNIDKPDFYVASPEGAGKQTTKDGKLVWERATDGTFFGSAHQYDEFILDFKLCSIYGDSSTVGENSITSVDKWIGLDLSRATVDYSTYGSQATILTYITPYPDEINTRVSTYCDPLRSPLAGQTITRIDYHNIPADMFRAITYSSLELKENIKPSDAICFRYVSEGGNLTLYIKKASDITFTKICTFVQLKLQGYFTLCCTGWTFVEFDDFSMTNTSPIYICADNDTPEIQIETETEIIYDNQNNDVNLAEELSLNYGIWGTITIIMSSVAFISLSAAVIFFILMRKAQKKNETRH